MNRLQPARLRVFAGVVVLTLLCGSEILLAADDEARAAAGQASSERARDELVCKRLKPPTGSRLGGRQECRTQAEWDAMARDAQRAVEDAPSRRAENELGQ